MTTADLKLSGAAAAFGSGRRDKAADKAAELALDQACKGDAGAILEIGTDDLHAYR
jgi:hypothetical protein